MELLVASAIGILTAAGIYLILRFRTFPVIVGTAFLSYAVNVFLFALVLTAIVIGFGMTAVVVMIGLGAYLESDTDHIDVLPGDPDPSDLLDISKLQEIGASEAPAARATAKPGART